MLGSDEPTVKVVDPGVVGALEADGAAALAAIRAEVPDAVMSDWNMPVMDGLTFIREVRTRAEHRFTPILMLTTESSDEMKANGKAAGATGWLVKPFDPAKLIEVIGKVIR